MNPLEFEYCQLINGKMYPVRMIQGRLVTAAMPLTDGVTSTEVSGTAEQIVNKVDTVTPKYPTQEEHSG